MSNQYSNPATNECGHIDVKHHARRMCKPCYRKWEWQNISEEARLKSNLRSKEWGQTPEGLASRRSACDRYRKTEHGRARRLQVENERDARKNNLLFERIEKDFLYERDGGTCYLCNLPVDKNYWDIEHVIPISLEGPHTYDNVRVSHPICNSIKMNLTLSAALMRLADKGVTIWK